MAPPPELHLHMLPYRHATLSQVLYGPEHGQGERLLDIRMESGINRIQLDMPFLMRYEHNIPILTTKKVPKDKFKALVKLVKEEHSLRVLLNDGNRDHLGRLTMFGRGIKGECSGRDRNAPGDGGEMGCIKVKVCWREDEDEIRGRLRRGIGWEGEWWE